MDVYQQVGSKDGAELDILPEFWFQNGRIEVFQQIDCYADTTINGLQQFLSLEGIGIDAIQHFGFQDYIPMRGKVICVVILTGFDGFISEYSMRQNPTRYNTTNLELCT